MMMIIIIIVIIPGHLRGRRADPAAPERAAPPEL